MLVVVVISKATVDGFIDICIVLLISVLIYVVEQSYLVQVLLHLTDHVGDKGRFHLFAFKTTPLEFIEKFVLFNLTGT